MWCGVLLLQWFDAFNSVVMFRSQLHCRLIGFAVVVYLQLLDDCCVCGCCLLF